VAIHISCRLSSAWTPSQRPTRARGLWGPNWFSMAEPPWNIHDKCRKCFQRRHDGESVWGRRLLEAHDLCSASPGEQGPFHWSDVYVLVAKIINPYRNTRRHIQLSGQFTLLSRSLDSISLIFNPPWYIWRDLVEIGSGSDYLKCVGKWLVAWKICMANRICWNLNSNK
jgi:hypothetical protein